MIVNREPVKIYTLGEFLEELEEQDVENDASVKIDVDDSWYDVEYIDSWRGSYDKPALGYVNNEKHAYVDFLGHVKEAQCMDVVGWKGGEYVTNPNDLLMVDNSGVCTSYRYVTGFKVLFNGDLLIITDLLRDVDYVIRW